MHKIQWLNIPGYKPETWNPIVGCSKISDGCTNCYAERMARRLSAMPATKSKYTGIIKDGRWSGGLNVDTDLFYKPFAWRKPRAVFVCSMSDLFHEKVDQIAIDSIMVAIALNPKHLFIVLTKRADRMHEYFSVSKQILLDRWSTVLYEEMALTDYDGAAPDALDAFMHNRANCAAKAEYNGWPLNNLWLGVTAENQQTATERIPLLLATPAHKSFVSIEPMLEPILLKSQTDDCCENFLSGAFTDEQKITTHFKHLDWVIAGGESGPNARPMHPNWVRTIRDNCKDAQVPFFFKSWGAWQAKKFGGDGTAEFNWCERGLPFQWMCKVGSKKSGCELDGKTHQEFPTR